MRLAVAAFSGAFLGAFLGPVVFALLLRAS